MQSFRERGGFQGNQRCYQQESHELSRLENYRHHSQTGQSYEVHSLPAAGVPTAGTSSKDCYGQQPYPSYGSSSAQSKKSYRGGKASSQHLQAGYSSHMNSGYSSQYMSEGHLQQKWDESGQISQYEQDIVGHLEAGTSGSSQYIEQNMLAISQSQCHLPSQPSAPVYTSPHQQGHPPNPTPSPLIYPQSHIHFPQHSQTPSATSSSYMEKCNPIPLGYKSGYGMPPNAQYSRQMGNHSSLKQSGYRPQNNYGYQQPSSRAGFEQQPPLQAMSSAPESLQKFSHYNQTQQNYCITDISVRSPEQYYQNCSPSSSHSPARSVGRSPSYSSTPSPLMPNPDTFQYSQPTNPSSSSVNLQDPNMLMPPHTHPSPSVNHQSQNYSSAMKDRFSEKLFSNPSLWSLNALTSQVENISNNVQQLLLSEALMANKKGNKRNQMKKGEEYRGHLKTMEDSSCPDSQHVPLLSDSYGTPRSMPSDLLEVGYTSSADEQMERTYYYFGQGKGSTQASAQSQLSLDTVSTCSINSTDDMSVRSGDSDRSIQGAASEDNLSCDPRVQRVAFGEEQHSSLISNRNESSPISVTATSPMKQETNSPIGIKQSENTQKENFEESAWTERINDEKESEKIKLSTEQKCKGEDFEATEKPQEWFEDEKCPSFFHKLNKEVSNESFCYETEDNIYQKLKNKYETEKGDFAGRCCDTRREVNEDTNMKSESQNKVDDPITASPVTLKDVPDSSLYLPRKVESSETHHLTSGCEFSEERQSTPERQNELFEEQSAQSYSVTEVREKKRESLTSSEDVINNKVKLEDFSKEACNNQGGEANGPLCVVNTEIAETPAQDLAHRSNERTLVTCDIAPQSHPVRSGFSTLNEKTTLQNQVRDHNDAKVLEPDSPQLPGKSIISSAPSWADTPPSPQKGDEDVEPGISCPSATKPEPMTSSAHPRLLGRKHARGRRRLIPSSTGMRSMERDGAQSSAQKPSILLNNNATFSDQMEAVQLDISSQTPKLLTEGLPSRMCTRSLGSQITPKGCSQEKGKPGSKSRSKPGPKPGPKPVIKLSSKPVLKTGPKQGPKPTSKPGQKASPKVGTKPSLKPATKQNSKPGPKQCPKPGAAPSVKSGPKPVPKPSAIPALKFGPKSGFKPTEGVTPKGPGRPKGLNPKIKSMKYENYTDSIPKHIEDASCMTETPEQEDHTEVSLETVVGTTLHTSIDSTMDSTLDTALDATFVNSAKDQKSMVLRSQKQTREKLTEDKEKETDISTEALAIKSTESHIVAAAQPCENLTSTLKSPDHEGISTESLIQLNEQIVSVSIKRKSSLQAPDSIKKKKGLKVSQTKTQESQPQELVVDAQGSKGSRKRGHKLEQSACSTPTKDNLVLEDIIDTPCVPPQCPTKTKYLPPRKGRGLKYEAMVQKITSPASKKQSLNIQPDVVLEELAPKQSPELQVQEKRRAVNTTMVTLEKVESTVSIEETPGTECIQTPRKKRKKWATVESTDTPDIAMETGSLIINTPRLAKQRAIKNNHEMHLKQRKKRRKGPELAKSMPIVETHEQTDVFSSSNAPAPSPPPASSLFSNTEEKTQGEQLTIETDLTVIKLKRGRRPSLKKKQEDDLRQPVGKEEGQKVQKKPGPKKKIQQNNSSTIKVTVKGFKPKMKCKKEWTPTVKGTLTNFWKTSDNKPSFRPYIHIDSSKTLASLCKLINKPEEERLLVQIRKKNLEKNRIIPNSSIMLQGPLVNRSLTDKCLICCLCGKPSNYKELGDLCGPYYPENTMPRKTLSLTYHEDFRRNRDREPDKEAMCSSEQINDMKNEGEKDLLQEGKSEGDCRLLMRERRAQHRSRLGLRARFKRLPLLQGRAGGGVPPAGEEGSYSVLQRLQLEAEANEHWAHEACTVWTSGVILIAGKLYGLKEAARESTLTKCSKCQTEGASISCSWKNCINKYHYVCAKDTGCTFDEDTFLIKCPKHQAM